MAGQAAWVVNCADYNYYRGRPAALYTYTPGQLHAVKPHAAWNKRNQSSMLEGMHCQWSYCDADCGPALGPDAENDHVRTSPHGALNWCPTNMSHSMDPNNQARYGCAAA